MFLTEKWLMSLQSVDKEYVVVRTQKDVKGLP